MPRWPFRFAWRSLPDLPASSGEPLPEHGEPDETEVKKTYALGLKWLPVEASLRREVTQRWAGRAADVLQQVEVEPDVLAGRLRESEALDAGLSAAFDAAAKTALAAKRRLLGRLINQAVLDDAKVDDATLRVGILGQIDAPHVRALEVVYRAELAARSAGEVEARAEGAEREIHPGIRAAGLTQPPPVLIALASLGLLETTATYGGDMIVKGLTPFGEGLLNSLRDADGDGVAELAGGPDAP